MPIADIADYERTSALRRDLDQLSSDAGAKLLRALGVNGDETELRTASDEFTGHCLALTLLGSYLAEAYNGYSPPRRSICASCSRPCDREPTPEKSWSCTRFGLVKALR